MAINSTKKKASRTTPRMKNMKGNTKSLEQKQIDEVLNSYEKDKEAGLYDLASSGNYTKLVRYLFDPYSQLKFRKCKNLYVKDGALYFQLRSGDMYHCQIVFSNTKSRVMYKLYNSKHMIESTFSQDEAIQWLGNNIEF